MPNPRACGGRHSGRRRTPGGNPARSVSWEASSPAHDRRAGQSPFPSRSPSCPARPRRAWRIVRGPSFNRLAELFVSRGTRSTSARATVRDSRRIRCGSGWRGSGWGRSPPRPGGRGRTATWIRSAASCVVACRTGEVFCTLREAQVLIEARRAQYDPRRPHRALDYRPPAPAVIPLRKGHGQWVRKEGRPKPPLTRNSLRKLVAGAGFEPATFGL